MIKPFRKILFLLTIGVLSVTSFGLSYFYFDNKQNADTSIKDNVLIDDIEENYDFGKNAIDKEGRTYTIYFFPSASYLHLYSEYLNGNTAYKPEEQFGYKEPNLDEFGNIVTNDDGDTLYKLSENTGKYSEIIGAEVTYDGAYRRYMGANFPTSVFETDGYKAYNDDDGYMASYKSLDADKKRTWGVPGEEFNICTSDSNRYERFNGRNQYSTDRLGCWGDCYYYGQTVRDGNDDGVVTGMVKGTIPNLDALDETNTGRYIPIKLTIKNELTSSVLEKALQNVFTSMGSQNDWHNYSLCEWTYVQNPDGDNPTYPYSTEKSTQEWGENTIGEAFQPVPRSAYFDKLSDLSKYADSNNVIRLFPYFSNGKKMNATNSYTSGGGAAEQLLITDASDNYVYRYPLFHSDVYDNGSGCFAYDENGTSTEVSLLKSQYIRMFNYNNIDIDSSNISELNFRSQNIDFNNRTPSNWGTYWWSLYKLDAASIKTNLIDKYGEGLYSFHVFIANYSFEDSELTSDNVAEYKATFDSFYDNIVTQAMNGAFSSLKGHRLIQITDKVSENLDSADTTSEAYYLKCSPTVVVFEKIDEPRYMVTDSLPSDFDSYLNSDYEHGRDLWRNKNDLYEGEASRGKYVIEGSDLSSDYPYIYFIKNVDLTDDSSYFVIGFGDSYSTSYKYSTASQCQYEYMISDPGDKTDIKEEDIYVNALGNNGYIESVEKTDDKGVTYHMFKIKSSDYADIYDIMLKYNTETNTYDIYMRRHDKLFLYVFDKNLTDPEEGKFVDHSFDSSGLTSSGAKLLFDRLYAEGKSLSSQDRSTTINPTLSLDECLRNEIGGSSAYNGELLLNYRLLDRGTGVVVAKYVAETAADGTTAYTLECNLNMQKNHILYLDVK